MNTPSRPLPVTSLRSLRNSRTRIFAAGADPKFGRRPVAPTFRLVPAFPDERSAAAAPRLWSPGLIDRLQAPVSRYRE